MSARLQAQWRLRAMTTADIDAVLGVERAAYAFPWSRANFVDSLAGGYLAEMLVDEHDAVIGYCIAMSGIDEMHLLNLSVAPAQQGRGHASTLLDALQRQCSARGAYKLWLEVRAGNDRARAVYTRRGFAEVGMRRGYYPASEGRREDAIVMSLNLQPVARYAVD